MTLYTVARSDGDNRQINLTKEEAAELICQIAWEVPREKSTYSDEQLISFARDIGDIRADCQTMDDYIKDITGMRDEWAAFLEEDPDDKESRENLAHFERV